MSRGRGRPSGSANREYVSNDVAVSACPQCGCTERTPYDQATAIERSTITPDGLRELVILRTCRCLNCGTPRQDRCLERIRPAGQSHYHRRGRNRRKGTPL